MTELRDRTYQPKGRECMCPTCFRVFSGERLFDRHRKGGECIPPESIGLRLIGGKWKGEELSEESKARLAALRP